MKLSSEKQTYVGFGIALVLLILVIVVSYWSTTQAMDTANWAIRSHEIVRQITDMNFRLYAAESGQRSFLITGRPGYVEGYQGTMESIRRDISQIRKLTEDNPAQQKRLDTLELLIAKRMALFKEWVRLQKTKGFDAAMEVIMKDEGKKIADDLQKVISDMESEERRLLRQRSESAEISARNATFVISFGYILICVLFVVGCYVILTGFGDRRRIEEMLRQSQREVSTLLDSLPAYVFFKDSKSVYVTANKKFCEAVGYTKREIVRKTDYDLYPRDIAIKNRSDDARVIMAGEPIYVGEEGLVEGGRQITVATRKVPLKNERGSVVGLIGVGFDITEIKQSQRALRESEERFRNIFSQSPIGIQVYTSDGRLMEINKACLEIFGVGDMEEVKKIKLFEEPYVPDEVKMEMEKGEVVRFEVKFDYETIKERVSLKTSRSGTCYLDCLVSPMGSEEATQRFLLLIQDTTERRIAEERIRASLREKEVLLKEVHHRVKNNLQIISSLLNLQSKYIKDGQALEMFKESRNRIRSMTLIHEKLYRSKDLANIDVADYIQNLTSNLFRSYNVGAVTLKTHVDDILLGIDTAIPCGLIINELVSNSLKHAFPEKKGEIGIHLHKSDGNFTLVVKDNGVGLPEAIDFRNTDSLGLQLVCTLTDQLEGDIQLTRSGGTEFKIQFAELKYKERA